MPASPQHDEQRGDGGKRGDSGQNLDEHSDASR